MNRELNRQRNQTLQQDGTRLDLVQQHAHDVPAQAAQPTSFQRPAGFVTFRYTSTEVFSHGSELHVKMHETRYQDGRLSSQDCEGAIDRQAYERMVADAQAVFLKQMFGIARLLLAPFGSHRD
ncbi:hypothetical protein [Noviherbaspirillum saxi]|uniref:Uncharacterized protein n=1 Tax=Noviherbaspirillum saxi TaxID=2320863 RepID=A0A3A3FUT1_9BURK|nr:hypothetical protein [Noviherbaspirillum saxi]RJF99826.1 hypothetical protein D3871_15825 [Noviherbaspirillum saxi]